MWIDSSRWQVINIWHVGSGGGAAVRVQFSLHWNAVIAMLSASSINAFIHSIKSLFMQIIRPLFNREDDFILSPKLSSVWGSPVCADVCTLQVFLSSGFIAVIFGHAGFIISNINVKQTCHQKCISINILAYGNKAVISSHEYGHKENMCIYVETVC